LITRFFHDGDCAPLPEAKMSRRQGLARAYADSHDAQREGSERRYDEPRLPSAPEPRGV